MSVSRKVTVPVGRSDSTVSGTSESDRFISDRPMAASCLDPQRRTSPRWHICACHPNRRRIYTNAEVRQQLDTKRFDLLSGSPEQTTDERLEHAVDVGSSRLRGGGERGGHGAAINAIR